MSKLLILLLAISNAFDLENKLREATREFQSAVKTQKTALQDQVEATFANVEQLSERKLALANEAYRYAECQYLEKQIKMIELQLQAKQKLLELKIMDKELLKWNEFQTAKFLSMEQDLQNAKDRLAEKKAEYDKLYRDPWKYKD